MTFFNNLLSQPDPRRPCGSFQPRVKDCWRGILGESFPGQGIKVFGSIGPYAFSSHCSSLSIPGGTAKNMIASESC